MEWVQTILTWIVIFLASLFLKNYMPTYMDKKGENLATKEDIAEITRITEETQRTFKEDFQLFSTDTQFKYDFHHRQLSELYSKLYAVIVQSEYVRHFEKISHDNVVLFDDAPFLEISQSQSVTEEATFKKGEKPQYTRRIKYTKTPISEFNKTYMSTYIINHGELASQTLLKIAVSYRFAENYYSGSANGAGSDVAETADEEEFRLIREMVHCIVTEYNQLRKSLLMDYDEEELITGTPHI